VGGSWEADLNVASSESPYLAFVVGLHVATAIALLIYFWRDWVRIVRGFFSSIGHVIRPAAGTSRWQLQSADERAAAMKDFKLTVQAKAGTEGKLYGSIGTSDIAEALTRAGLRTERSEVRLPSGPLRMLGEHVVSLHLHADIDVPLHVSIIAEE